jgi:hypothetical protein
VARNLPRPHHLRQKQGCVGRPPLGLPSQGSTRRSQTAVVAQERNAVVLGKKNKHPRHGAKGLAHACPERGPLGNRAANQLSEGLFEGRDSRGQGTPRSSEATRLHDPGRRVQALSLDPRPLVEVPLQSLGPNRPVRQPIGGQHRKSPTARPTEIALNLLLEGPLRIRIAQVTPMPVHLPPTTTGTHRRLSSELVFAQLNRATSPKSSRPIKPRNPGPHDATHRDLLSNVPHPRSHLTPQRYTCQRPQSA